jgi:hypothetical protein
VFEFDLWSGLVSRGTLEIGDDNRMIGSMQGRARLLGENNEEDNQENACEGQQVQSERDSFSARSVSPPTPSYTTPETVLHGILWVGLCVGTLLAGDWWAAIERGDVERRRIRCRGRDKFRP